MDNKNKITAGLNNKIIEYDAQSFKIQSKPISQMYPHKSAQFDCCSLLLKGIQTGKKSDSDR